MNPAGGRASVKSKRSRKSNYNPPESSAETALSCILQGTERFPSGRQMSLLGGGSEKQDRTDLPIYYAGDLSVLQKPCVAIVGTRNVSEKGAKRTRRLARELVGDGVTVVSGLAAGVDTAAHLSAIEAGGSTAAVIGTPLDKAYPAANAVLQETIYRNHLLISRFAPGERTYRSSFPLRNKLMATVSDATVVMEASDTSGTLHQAAECTRLGRWLFIARSVVDDQSLEWPKKFLKYDTCLPLEDVTDITGRICEQRI